ncbi:MAG: thioredoxin domain-containing protein [Candidatus Falkowbacteria bacterium]|nr:thioredoxin domain-containing protein [Candidatus Falkowbacteria bacterium]
MKLKNILAIIIAIILVFTIALLVASRPKLILFYSSSCQHCKNVEDFINANKVKDKIKFRELEVSQNQSNANLMVAKAKGCGLNTDQGLAVPFLFDGKNCLTGDVDIIQVFETKIK